MWRIDDLRKLCIIVIWSGTLTKWKMPKSNTDQECTSHVEGMKNVGGNWGDPLGTQMQFERFGY